MKISGQDDDPFAVQRAFVQKLVRDRHGKGAKLYIEELTGETIFTAKSLLQFRNGTLKRPSRKTIEIITRALRLSQEVRNIGGLGKDNVSNTIEQVSKFMVSGCSTGNAKKYVGHYYACHGSYISEDSVVVRKIDVQIDAIEALRVTDTIRDSNSKVEENKLLVTYGVMTFINDLPQIILYSENNENRLGLSVMFSDGRLFSEDEDSLQTVSGCLSVFTSGNKAYSRRFLMFREREKNEKDMLRNCGIFHISQVQKMDERFTNAFRTISGSFAKDKGQRDPLMPLVDPSL